MSKQLELLDAAQKSMNDRFDQIAKGVSEAVSKCSSPDFGNHSATRSDVYCAAGIVAATIRQCSQEVFNTLFDGFRKIVKQEEGQDA